MILQRVARGLDFTVMVGEATGLAVFAYAPSRIATPTAVRRNVGIIQSVRHQVQKSGRVAFDTVLVFGIDLAKVAVVLNVGFVFKPVLSAGAVLVLPSALIPDEKQISLELASQPL